MLETGAPPITRVRVLTGDDADPTRRGSKTVIAFSDCRYYCPDAATVERCVEHLRASDERLRSRPEEQMLWDWQCTYFEADTANASGGGTVILGVSWYERAFFDDRRDAWFGAMHTRIYKEIGVPMEDVTVEHWLALEVARWKAEPQSA
ncbi:hypothetical protein [Streptomyces griseocarneus]|uniref:hypothetical protein n=1 Tax=Streptomyces griseocarneus TaxID=51201 RepID=UPI001CCC5D1A|nr:hypothetical protein [Streptomyces griseocarneus]MBZ6475404.1 hypothetical protein [Streptomyces griseocarneus]